MSIIQVYVRQYRYIPFNPSPRQVLTLSSKLSYHYFFARSELMHTKKILIVRHVSYCYFVWQFLSSRFKWDIFCYLENCEITVIGANTAEMIL